MDTEVEDEDEREVQEMLHGLIDEVTHQTERREGGAPIYPIPTWPIGAVELPAIVQNIDRAEKALGRVSLDWNEVRNSLLTARRGPRSSSPTLAPGSQSGNRPLLSRPRQSV
jgi:hypothetical protein